MVVEKKKHRKKQQKDVYETNGSPFNFKNTIMSTIMIGMLIFIIVLSFFPAYMSCNQIEKAQTEIPTILFDRLAWVQELKKNVDSYINPVTVTPNRETRKTYSSKLEETIKNINQEEFLSQNNVNIRDIFIIDYYGQFEKEPTKIVAHAGIDENKNIELNEDEKRKYKKGFFIKGSDKVIYKLIFGNFDATLKVANDGSLNIENSKNKLIIRIPLNSPQKGIRFMYLVLNDYAGKDTNYFDSIVKSETKFISIMLLIALIVIFIFARSISKPLVEMEKTVSKIADGDLSGRLEYTKYDEINQLVQSYNEMANALQRLYSTLEKQVQDRTQELKSAYAELQSTQAMMVHSEKMKSLGELVAGIMHEINNPINFIYGNMTHLHNYSSDLINLIEEYTKFNASLKPEEKADIEKLKEEMDYEFLKSDLPDLIKSCKEGADRAKNIIQDLKSFSRMEEASITDVDLGRELDTVLNILHNKIKNKAEVHKEYDEKSVPAIEAFGGQLNQVFMNILDNAIGAIEDHGDIWIRMNKDKTGKNVVIEIEDNGKGMDADTVDKVFNPFFTTKPVGQGTGLGMSITYKIIKSHQGDIRVESKPNVGSKFIVTLPINFDRDALNMSMKDGDANG